MAYTLSIGNPRSNQAPTVQKSAKSLKLNKILRFDQSGCLLERRGGAETALSTYRQMPRYRRQAQREMPSFFILECRVVRFMPRRAAAPEGPQSPHWLPAAPPGIEGLLSYLFQVLGEVFKQLNASYREKE